MSFAGKVWRLLVGIKDGLALVFLLLFFGVLFAVLSARPNPAQVREGALLLSLDGAIVEEVATIDPLGALLSNSLPTREYAARDLVQAIDEAARDERIKAIALDLTTFTGGPAVSLREVAEALARFRAADKPIVPRLARTCCHAPSVHDCGSSDGKVQTPVADEAASSSATAA